MQITNINKNGGDIPITIFRNDITMNNGAVRTYYKAGVSHKKQDNTFENGYIPVQFNKEVILNDKTKIVIKNAILEFYIDKDKKTVPYIRVFEFKIIENTKQLENTIPNMGVSQNASDNVALEKFKQYYNSNSGEEYITLTDEQVEDLPF